MLENLVSIEFYVRASVDFCGASFAQSFCHRCSVIAATEQTHVEMSYINSICQTYEEMCEMWLKVFNSFKNLSQT